MRVVGFDRCFRRKSLFFQPSDHSLADLRREPWQPAGRQFFAADLEQQFAIHQTLASTCGAVSATYALAMPTASCRTPRMYAVRSVTPMLLLESSLLSMCEHLRQCSSVG